MKLICDCGAEHDFSVIDEETGQPTKITEEEGQYARRPEGFHFWSNHYQVGLVCEYCGKALWVFK